MAVSGALITAVFQFEKLVDVRNYLLCGGLFFAGLLSIALGQNLYYQTVAEDLMDAIKNGERVRGDRIPKRRVNGPSFVQLMKRVFLKTGSIGLFILSVGLTGFLGSLINDTKFPSETRFCWWVGTGIIVLGLTILINFIIYACNAQPLNLSQKEKDNQWHSISA